MPRFTNSRMFRRAVSDEHLVMAAHFEVVSFPSNPSNRRFSADNIASQDGRDHTEGKPPKACEGQLTGE